MRWIDERGKFLREKTVEPSTGDQIRGLLEEHKKLQEEIQFRQSSFQTTYRRGEALEEHAPPNERRDLSGQVLALRQKWDELNKNSLKRLDLISSTKWFTTITLFFRQRSLEDALVQSGRFDEILSELFEWLSANLAPLEAECHSPNSLGDVETLHTLLSEHFQFVNEQVESRRPNVQAINERAKKVVPTTDENGNDVGDKFNRLQNEWSRLEHLSTAFWHPSFQQPRWKWHEWLMSSIKAMA